MAVSAKWFSKALLGQYSKTAARRVNWEEDTIKVALTTSSYTPDQDEHDFFNDVTNELAETGGYTSGGKTLSGATATYDGASNTVRLDANDVEWTSASFTAAKAVIYKSTGEASTSPLLGWVDFGGNETVSSGTFKIIWDATDGILRLVVS